MLPQPSSEYIQSFKNTPAYNSSEGKLEAALAAIDTARVTIPGVTDSYVHYAKQFARAVYTAFGPNKDTDETPWMRAYNDIEDFKKAYQQAVYKTVQEYLAERSFKARKMVVFSIAKYFRNRFPEHFLIFPVIAVNASSQPLDDGSAFYRLKVVVPNGEQLFINGKQEER